MTERAASSIRMRIEFLAYEKFSEQCDWRWHKVSSERGVVEVAWRGETLHRGFEWVSVERGALHMLAARRELCRTAQVRRALTGYPGMGDGPTEVRAEFRDGGRDAWRFATSQQRERDRLLHRLLMDERVAAVEWSP